MAIKRTTYQGVLNIIRFNWHFYLIAGTLALILIFISLQLPAPISGYLYFGISIAVLSILLSLIISHVIYDRSQLYELQWLNQIEIQNRIKIFNLNAGFDETSEIIRQKFPTAELTVGDFYNPQLHTEISIRRARKLYPPYPGTITLQTSDLQFAANSFDYTLAIFSLHEIRDHKERTKFLMELARVTERNILITEHLRDFNNFLAYNIGAFHFHSLETWKKNFSEAGLNIKTRISTTPFITTFVLTKNGTTL